jgi:ribonuclease P protein component
MPTITVIKRRADFLAAARSDFKYSTPTVAVQARRRAETEPSASPIRIGFTATRHLGGAVARNRAKRRLRAAAAHAVMVLGQPGCDYVFLGRDGTIMRAFDDLIRDMKHALKRLADKMSELEPQTPGT